MELMVLVKIIWNKFPYLKKKKTQHSENQNKFYKLVAS